MLKITYTDNGLHLEHLNLSLESWLANRVLVCLRAGTSVYAEPSTASLLLPANLPYLQNAAALKEQNSNLLDITVCDQYSVETSLKGTWVTTDEADHSGIFVCKLDEEVEFFFYQLWKEGSLDNSLVED